MQPQLLRKFLKCIPKWDATPIMLSGNTDCYQPAEQTYRLTKRGCWKCAMNLTSRWAYSHQNSWILKTKMCCKNGKKQIVSAHGFHYLF